MASSSCPPLGFGGEYYTLSSGGQCVRQSSFFEGKPVLNQGVGYSVVLGFGAFFAVFTSFLVCLLFLYLSFKKNKKNLQVFVRIGQSALIVWLPLCVLVNESGPINWLTLIQFCCFVLHY